MCYTGQSVTISTTATAQILSSLAANLGERGAVLRTARVTDAARFAEEIYASHQHWTGVPLLAHVTAVLETFLAFQPDEDAVIACLLHHALDTKAVTLRELEERFGATVRSIVSGAHLLAHVSTHNRRMSMENLRLMFVRVSDDIRIVLMILCDQTVLLDHLPTLGADERRHLCQDALHLFAPVAARLGMYNLKHRLERRAFPVVYPVDALRIEEQLAHIHSEHGTFLEQAAMQLSEHLRTAGISARVDGREKEPYSIFCKTRTKAMTQVRDLYDLFALRVVVEDESACYQSLGVIHRLGHAVQNRFKDYIAFPKPNGYQSLHTTLTHLPGVPEGVFVEVQIRTTAMHREAEVGIAAHWSYKEGGETATAMRRVQLSSILSLQQPLEEGGRRVPVTDHIFVLTPRGDVVELPEGATPLDFAFSVHTDLGLAFKAARVNGSIAPLTYGLENGDVVEIIRHPVPRPSPQWMLLLRTSQAKSRLRRFLAVEQRPLLVMDGRSALNEALRERGLPPLDPDLSILRSVDERLLPMSEREDLLQEIGQGTVKASTLLPHIDALSDRLRPLDTRRKTVVLPGTFPVRVEGEIPLPVRAARCCRPDIGERVAVVGVVTRTGDVRVHKSDCRMIRNGNPERRVEVRWVGEMEN